MPGLFGKSCPRFVYDADGNLMVLEGPKRMVYIGGIFEKNVESGEVTKYYHTADGRRLAMRKGTTLSYFANDHLGGTSVVMNDAGGVVSRVRYYPYGNIWTQETGAPPTDKLFTGQRRYGPRSGIYHYGARFYSADIGRFLSPDSIVPGAGNPQALNRYAYVLNNPMTYNDPSGHCIPDINCAGQDDNENTDQVSPGMSPASGMPTGGPAPPNFASCGANIACTEVGGQKYYTLTSPLQNNFAALELLLQTGVELIPFYRIGDLASLTGFIATCASGDCDEVYLAAAVPGITVGMVKGARLVSAATPSGVAGKIGRITVSAQQMAKHVIPTHTTGGAKTAGKSVFSPGTDLMDLIREAEALRIQPVPSHHGNNVIIVGTDRTVGTNQAGAPTRFYSIVIDREFNLVTMHPGWPEWPRGWD